MRSKIDFTKVGQHIKTARTEANKTQKEVALACGCDPKHISAVETGKTNPSIDLLTMLSEELNVSVDYFLKDARTHTSDTGKLKNSNRSSRQ